MRDTQIVWSDRYDTLEGLRGLSRVDETIWPPSVATLSGGQSHLATRTLEGGV